MLLDWLVPALLVLVLALVSWLALRRPPVARDAERQARELRDDIARSAQGTRQEIGATLAHFQQMLLTQQGDTARTQNDQIDAFSRQLAAMQQQLSGTLGEATLAQVEQARLSRESLDRKMGEVRLAVESKLTTIQGDSEKKLEQIRATVDEKLHATLEQRLGESFRQVAERLEQVHRGIGEMQKLATDVGSLNRVLTNVRSRGVFGEVQLGALLDQVLTIEQYATNVETIPASGARVEFAVKLPGRREDRAPLWLPIDCKFPRDDYERLVEAQEAADRPAMEAAGRAIETRFRSEARTIREKYIAAPHTTDFAIMFVPTEGLYAEALRRPGLVESLQREHKVMLTGPTTLLATLSSLQMGFRTLALEQRSAEVWETLGAVKTEFAKFGEVLAKTKKKLDEAASSIDMAERRTRVMARELRDVEALPDSRAQAVLPGLLGDDEMDD
ncbi:MAG: DNA recombination protein RmuC [Caldimonas sp.]